MMRDTLPFRRILRQPLTFTASTASIALSFSMTLAAACHRWQANLPFAVGTAVTCELLKLALASRAVALLRSGRTRRDFITGACSGMLFAVFAMGSVASSVLCMSQSEGTEQLRALAASQVYSSALADLQTLDAQIATLAKSAGDDVAGTFRSRGLKTLERLDGLRQRRDSAAAKVAALEQRSGVTTGPLAVLLRALHVELQADIVELTIESLIGGAIEIAAFLLLCGAREPKDAPTPPDRGPTPGQKHRRFRIEMPRTSTTKRVADLGHIATMPAANRNTSELPPTGTQPTQGKELPLAHCREGRSESLVPPTYARYLRYSFGTRTGGLLDKLAGNPRHAGCRDLLQRMGDHCLRVGFTNGDIHRDVIRADLREGRDWRTINGYLSLLADVGAVTVNGDTYTIAHFLAANPSVNRRKQRLQDVRNKACKRQHRRRNVQKLHATNLQNADLSASRAARHAENPQPTPTAVQAAHAATHQPTAASVKKSSQEKRPGRTYGAVSAHQSTSDAEHEERLRRLAQPRGSVTEAEALKAALQVEQEWATEAAARPVAPPRRTCIPVPIPDDPTPVNFDSVAQACEKIGLPKFGWQTDDLFRVLGGHDARQAELQYATFCTARGVVKGSVRHPASHLVEIILRQRAAKQAA